MNIEDKKLYQTNFYAFYLYVSGNSKTTNWWERDFCNFCELCYLYFKQGKRPLWYIEAPVQHGKCFVKDTKIIMYNGFLKNIQDIKVGDKVMGINGESLIVDGLHNGYDTLYKIDQYKGISYTVNSQHDICLKTNLNIKNKLTHRIKDNIDDNGFIIISAEDYYNLSKYDKSCVKGYKTSGLNFDHKNVEIDPYILGLWLGDGNSDYSAITSMDTEVIFSFKNYCENLGLKENISHKKDNKASTYKYTTGTVKTYTNGNIFVKKLRDYNLYKNKHIPQDYMFNSIDNRLKLLAGIIDTDGHLCYNRGKLSGYEISQKDGQFAKDIIFLCKSLGFRTTSFKKVLKGEIYLRINIFGNLSSIPCKVLHKKTNHIADKDVSVTGIKSITKIGVGEYFGFSVKGNEKRFLLSDFTVVHNSLKMRFFLAWFVGKHRNLRFNFYTGDDKLRKETSDFIQELFKNKKYLDIFGNVLKPKGTENIDTLQLDGGQIDFRLLSSGQVGYPSNVSLIDDPYSKSEQASSDVQKETIITRFNSGVISRRQSQSLVLVTHSRWFPDDLIGRIKENVRTGKYKDIDVKGFSYPAIAIEDEKYRKENESLFPELRDINFLKEQRSLMTEEEFASLYQQNPILAGGNMFKLDWFMFTEDIPDNFDYRFITADIAYKDKEQNDFTVFGYWGVINVEGKRRLYLIDMQRAKIKALDIERWIEGWIKEKVSWKFRYIWIEDKAHGIYLNQAFRQKGYPIPSEEQIKETLPRDRDKVERANNVLPWIDKLCYNVYINKNIECIEVLKDELLGFPKAKHDDICDTIIDAIKIALAGNDVVAEYEAMYGK